MKGQTEIIVFILLFVVGVTLFMSAIVWGRGLVEKNSDVAKMNAAEAFMKNLDTKIQGVISFGGRDSIPYTIDAPIELVGTDLIEIKSEMSVNIPDVWVTIKENGAVIREIMERNMFRIQLYYPLGEYQVELYTNGPRIANPNQVIIEKTASTTPGKIKIKITFQ